MHRILFICHGNICRSTMAQSVMTELVRRAGREDEFEIDSAATSYEEIGNPPHWGTETKLREVGTGRASSRLPNTIRGTTSYIWMGRTAAGWRASCVATRTTR